MFKHFKHFNKTFDTKKRCRVHQSVVEEYFLLQCLRLFQNET